MAVQLKDMIERFPELLKIQQGTASLTVTRLHVPHLATASDMIFVSDKKHLNDAKRGQSQIWVVQTKLLEAIPQPWPENILVSPNPYLAMALISRDFFPLKPGVVPVDGKHIHPTSVIS